MGIKLLKSLNYVNRTKEDQRLYQTNCLVDDVNLHVNKCSCMHKAANINKLC